MKVRIEKQNLLNVLSVVQNVTEKRNTMPILSNVLLSASNDLFKISATDLELSAEAKAQAVVESHGSTTVNTRIFCDIVRELPDGEVELGVMEGERLEISSGRSKAKIIGVSAEEYPNLPGLGLEPKGEVSSFKLSEMIKKSIYAVSVDESRISLTGICFEMSDGEEGRPKILKMVATDGHRLAVVSREVGEIGSFESVIVPKKGIVEAKKLLGDEDNPVGIGVEEGFLIIGNDASKVSVRLVDADFPDYSQVLPKSEGVTACIGVDEFVRALRRVSLLVTDKSKGIRLDFTAGNLRISSSSPELGEASEELGIEYDGGDLSVGFNARYLIDVAVSVEGSKTLNMELNGELGPGKFYVPEDESYFGIVMPMRLV